MWKLAIKDISLPLIAVFSVNLIKGESMEFSKIVELT